MILNDLHLILLFLEYSDTKHSFNYLETDIQILKKHLQNDFRKESVEQSFMKNILINFVIEFRITNHGSIIGVNLIFFLLLKTFF